MKKISVIFIAIILSTLSIPSFSHDLKKINKEQLLKEEITLDHTLVNLKENLTKETKTSIIKPIKKTGSLNLKEIFYASPLIYSLLFAMSIVSCVILLYTLFTFRMKDLMSKTTSEDLKTFLLNEHYDDAISYCESKKNLLSSMISSGLCTRQHGVQFMIDTIKSEGKRATADLWHRISILNDIVIVAPMLGLLGTVIGMFYAFYDINRSIDSLSALFDGLGIAVGTTVAGLVVAIIAMIFYAILKFKMIKHLNLIENEAISLGNLIRTKE